jgi:hypothetical protein
LQRRKEKTTVFFDLLIQKILRKAEAKEKDKKLNFETILLLLI